MSSTNRWITSDASGRITGYRTIPDGSLTLNAYPDENLVQFDSDVSEETHYRAGNVIVARPRMVLSCVTDTIRGIPEGAAVRIEDQEFTADGGEIQIEGYRGEVRISLWPYMDEVVTL